MPRGSRPLLALAGVALLGAAPPRPLALPLHLGGRSISDEAGGQSFGWPGVYFESRFRGRGLRIRLEAPAEHMRLLVDGREKILFRQPGNVDLVLGDLPEGEHVVRLEKQSESQSGGGRFLGFFAIDGDVALPAAPRERQIEFIGDSYTVGYGNTSSKRECSAEEVHDTTDTQAAFGPLVARRLDADYRINAYSGFGIIRNYAGGSRGLSLPILYPRLKPDDAEHLEREPGGWHPQLIVVNLGTNDFSTPLKPDEAWHDRETFEAAYRDAYVAFVRDLQSRQPQARFMLMGSELFYPQIEQIGAVLDKEMPGRVTIVRFSGLDHAGCHHHPSLADHRLLAELLETQIRALGKIW